MNIQQKPAIILAALATLTIVAGAGLYAANEKKKSNVPAKDNFAGNIAITGDVPADFFTTLQEAPPPPPPAPPKVLELPEIKEEKIILLPPPADIFNFVEKEEIPQLTPKEIKRKMVLQSLYSTSLSSEINSLPRRKKSPYGENYQAPDTSSQKNFDEHNIPTETATYPVNLERVLTMNKYIPATLYTEIESEVPSQKVIAIVNQDIVGFHGKKILIPKGTQAIGRYGKVTSPDTTRIGLVWYRMITPKGINIQLQAESADQEGASGIAGYVDQKWRDKYGTAFLFSAISAITQLSVPVSNDNAKAAADSFTSEIAPIVAEQLQQSMDILPRINIPQGEIIHISPLADIWFKKPQGNKNNVMPLIDGLF